MESHPINNLIPFVGCPPSQVLDCSPGATYYWVRWDRSLDPPPPEPPPKPPTELPTSNNKEAKNAKATKSDDAPVPVGLWNEEVARLLDITVTPKLEILLDKFCIRLVRLWKKRLQREFCYWYAKRHRLATTLPVISKSELDVCHRWFGKGRDAQTAREELLSRCKVW
eukprot:scaffold8884_cov44-Attheya_sp.AAC.4